MFFVIKDSTRQVLSEVYNYEEAKSKARMYAKEDPSSTFSVFQAQYRVKYKPIVPSHEWEKDSV